LGGDDRQHHRSGDTQAPELEEQLRQQEASEGDLLVKGVAEELRQQQVGGGDRTGTRPEVDDLGTAEAGVRQQQELQQAEVERREDQAGADVASTQADVSRPQSPDQEQQSHD